MAWELVNPFGIQVDDQLREGVRDTAWHAGHVNDILSLEPGYILVGSETGGVWFIDSTYKAMALSDDWLYPNVECLAHGPGGSQHVFAGCQGGLYEAIISRKYPFAPWKSVNLPGNASIVYRVVAAQEPPRIAIATDAGIWWADGRSPPGGFPSGRYNWQPVKNLPQEGFFGLALSPDGIVAGVRNSDPPATRRGIYYGRWSDGLTMQRAAVYLSQKAIANMSFISIASCRDYPRHAYAMTVASDGHVAQVLRSDDGGQQWNACPNMLEGNHNGSWNIAKFCGKFENGGWHKTISVHHQNPEVVALGGRRALLSTNGGTSWRGLGGDFTNPDRWDYANKHQHDDVHAVYFEPGYSGNRLYIASDGGVVQCEDWNEKPGRFKSAMNRNLANLQFYSPMDSREFWGTIGICRGQPIVGGGLQDNSDVWGPVRPFPQYWRKVGGGDGNWFGFIVSGADAPTFAGYDQLVGSLVDGGKGTAVTHAVWQSPNFVDKGAISLHLSIAGQVGGFVDTDGLKGPVAEVVPVPQWGRVPGRLLPAGLMLAVGAAGTLPAKDLELIALPSPDAEIDSRVVFGLFERKNEYSLYWEEIGRLPADAGRISALGTDAGYSVYAGTADGKIFLIDASSGQVTEMGIDPPSKDVGAIERIVVHFERGRFAVMRNNARSYILKLDGGWREIKSTVPPPAENYYGFDIFRGGGPVSMALATDTEVWVSPDDGDTWFRSVADLPRVPHCADLRFGKLEGADMLFLGTFGRSMWMISVQDLWQRRDRRNTTGRHGKFFPLAVGRALPQLGTSGAGSKKVQPRGGRKKAPRPGKKKAKRASKKSR